MKRWFIMVFVMLLCLWGGTVSAQSGTLDWSAEKQGVYQPLLTSNLEWSENVMKDGGFSLASDQVVKDKETADFVISQYGYIGARAIGKLSTFQQPIDKNTYTFPKDGLGYDIRSLSFIRGDVFLIESSDGKYVKIRIDEKSSERVKFTYVVEAEKPALEQFTPMTAKSTKDPKKEWKITFSKPVAYSTINESTVYVKDANGAIFPTTTRTSQDRLSVYIVPYAPYKAGEKYTIFISKHVKSENGELLKTGVSMVFTVTEADVLVPGWASGLSFSQTSGEPNYMTIQWNAIQHSDLVGYNIYYRVEGYEQATKLNTYPITATQETYIVNKDLYGKKIDFYLTVSYKNGKESAASAIKSYTIVNPSPQKETGWTSGLNLEQSSGKYYLSWNSESGVVGYYVYQYVEGRGGFTRLRNSGSANEYFSTNRIELTMDPSIPSGTLVKYYITLAYNDGTESVRSDIYSFKTGNQGGGDPGDYSRFFGSWNLAVTYADLGTLTIHPDGTYTRVGGPEKYLIGKWEVNRYGFVLLDADYGEDYIVDYYPERGGIKLMTPSQDGYHIFYAYGT